ncbi:MAG: multidrug effflux MFS transporter [Phenylobacterium sp.]|uniref:multidrug effflux MFS transporter n=1 Tax=Phenylobacterium sp. TaxID=1871053 RepID=UPI001A3CC3B7|nr:multidrug effflux MFS transporter [Phenylobacterium sp.]MBL8770002.1 multidrug effflux MFS transporter [Phenylobacterium sp.]
MTSANETSSGAPPRTPWGLVVLLGALTAMGPLAIDMYLPSLPAIAAGLEADPAQAQATVAAFLAGMAVGQPFYGPWSDRIGRRIPLLLGVLIFMAASAACALATSAEMLLAARFVQALGACAGGVVSRAILRDRFDHAETARMLSLMMLIMGLAPILAPILGSALLAVGGWRLNFWFMTIFGAALAVAAFARLRESRSEATAVQASTENPFQAYAALLRQRRLIGYGLAGALNGATLFTYIASSPGLIMGTYGHSATVYPWLFGLNALGVIGAGQVNRMILRRLTPDAVLLRASAIALVFAVLLALAALTGLGGQWTVLPLLFLLLASYGFMQGNTMAGALNVDPLRAGSISALMGTLSFATGAAAASLVALWHDGGPTAMALVMLAALVGSAVSLRTLALPTQP